VGIVLGTFAAPEGSLKDEVGVMYEVVEGAAPPGRGPRLPTVGGEPKMVILYSAWDLPEGVQHQLSRMH
jgi:hypothetical protein